MSDAPNAMGYFRVRNWTRYQHYRDRDPPWVKLYTKWPEEYETWSRWQDATKLLAVCIMMLAGRSGNCIPRDAQWIQQRFGLSQTPDLEPLFKTRFIEETQALPEHERDASKSPAKRSSERETEKRQRQTKERTRAGAREPAPVPRGTSNGQAIESGTALTRSAEQILGGMLDDWKRDVEGVNQAKCEEWLTHLERQGKRVGPDQRLYQARALAKAGDDAAQAEVVDYCKGQGYRTLIPLADVRRRTHSTAEGRAYVPPKTVAQLEAEEAARAGK